MNVIRYPENPLVTPADVRPSVDGWEVICAFNAGVIEAGDEVLMLMRVAERPVGRDDDEVLVPMLKSGKLTVVQLSRRRDGIELSDPRVISLGGKVLLTSISHLRLARSRDGVHFRVDPEPALFPQTDYEAYGLEDPRITRFDDTYYVVYKGVSAEGITQCLASTKDFVNWTRHGIILCPENMDAMILPEKVRGKYAALHRPMPKFMGFPNMWVAYSDDLVHWGEHKFLMGCTEGTWEGDRIGGGAVPFLTESGWLEIYHAATDDDRYCLGALLLDRDYPEKALAKSPGPILEPEAPYEAHGFKDNVVFTCGGILRGDRLTIYYGAGDRVMAAADFSAREILASLRRIA